jgi:hypothetical protein
MEKLNVIIFATCQGEAISKFLNTSKEFTDNFIITNVSHNYKYINDNASYFDANIGVIKNADVFIYQPLDSRFGKNATDYIKTLLKPTCKTISIPFVYNFSLWSIVQTLKGDTNDKEWDKRDEYVKLLLNIEVIDDLIKEGISSKNILKLYDRNAIDYKFAERHEKTMNILKEKDKLVDIKVYNYICENIIKKRLFLYCSHPTSFIFIHMTNQILKIFNLKEIDENVYDINFANLVLPIPVAHPTSAVNYFNFEFTTKAEEDIANLYYRKKIIQYLTQKKHF